MVSNDPAAKAAKEINEAAGAVKDLAAKSAKDFGDSMKAKLATLDQHIEELEASASKQADAGKAKLQETLASLKAKRDALGTKLEGLQAQSSDAWGEMAKGLTAAYEDLEKAVNGAVESYGSE